VGEERIRWSRRAAIASLVVALAGCALLFALRVANSGPEVPGRNWWLIAEALVAIAYLPAGAALVVWPERRLLGVAFVTVGVTQLLTALLGEWAAYQGHIGAGPGTRLADAIETVGALVLALAVPLLLPWRAREGRGDPLRVWFGLGVVAAVLGAFPAVIPVHDLPGADVVGPLLLMATVPLLVVGSLVATVRDESLSLASYRFLVWTVLLAGIAVVYTAIVAGSGALLGANGPAWLLVAATGLIALAMEPARRTAHRWVENVVYGERDDPLALVRHVVEHATTTVDVDALLPSVATTLGRSMRLDFVAIEVLNGTQLERVAIFGQELGARTEVFPVGQGDDQVGQVVVGCADGVGLRARDRSVLDEVVPQVWLAVILVRLTAELRRSNLAVLSGREEERRRLRRDLHDGMGPAVTGIAMAVRTLAKRLARDGADPANVALANRLGDEADSVSVEVKRIVRDLRPTALDNEGLTAAVTEFVRRLDGVVHVDLDMSPPCTLPAVVEIAAYRIATEALTNVVRHAQATTCRVRLTVDDVVDIDIVDDGVGVPADEPVGVGLVSIRERVGALGGTMAVMPVEPHGTRLHVTLPAVVA
jgi:signal transduction histidine kinase